MVPVFSIRMQHFQKDHDAAPEALNDPFLSKNVASPQIFGLFFPFLTCYKVNIQIFFISKVRCITIRYYHLDPDPSSEYGIDPDSANQF
jgi:hypothetical protein